MSANARTRQTLTARQFCLECGTSEHSAPITTPGAGSTVNINRGRRLGPPAKKQEISLHDTRQRVAVVLEMPVKPVDDAPVASELSPALAESQYSAADLSPSRPSAGHSDSDDPCERSVQPRSFWLAAIAVISGRRGCSWVAGFAVFSGRGGSIGVMGLGVSYLCGGGVGVMGLGV